MVMSIINTDPLDFNFSVNRRLKDLCYPLLHNFGITTFAYLKFLKNGQILHITNNHDWLSYYTSKNLYNDVNRYVDEINSIPENGAGYYLRSSKISNNFNEVLEKFGLWHGLSIYIRYSEYTEAWCFATISENHLIHDLYLNHTDALKHFILYFKSKASDLLDHSNKNKLLTTQAKSFEIIRKKPLEERVNNFFESTKIKTILLGDSASAPRLSCREAECIQYLSHGKATKEIARLLKISPRTVETYIDSLKKKVGCTMKNDLITHFTKLPDFTLLNNFHR